MNQYETLDEALLFLNEITFNDIKNKFINFCKQLLKKLKDFLSKIKHKKSTISANDSSTISKSKIDSVETKIEDAIEYVTGTIENSDEYNEASDAFNNFASNHAKRMQFMYDEINKAMNHIMNNSSDIDNMEKNPSHEYNPALKELETMLNSL